MREYPGRNRRDDHDASKPVRSRVHHPRGRQPHGALRRRDRSRRRCAGDQHRDDVPAVLCVRCGQSDHLRAPHAISRLSSGTRSGSDTRASPRKRTFLRSHGFFGSGRCYIVVVDGGEKKLVALEDFVQLCPDVILGPRLKPLGHGMRRYSKFFINRSRLPHHTHDVKEEAYWIEPAMVVDFDLFDELCFMAVGLHENFGPSELRAYLTRQALGRSGEGAEAARALGLHAPRRGDDHEDPDPARPGCLPAALRAAVLRRRLPDVRADAQDSALTAGRPRDPGAPARRSRCRCRGRPRSAPRLSGVR